MILNNATKLESYHMKQISILLLLTAMIATTGCKRYKSEERKIHRDQFKSRYAVRTFQRKRPNNSGFGLSETNSSGGGSSEQDKKVEVKTDTPENTFKSFLDLVTGYDTSATSMGFKDSKIAKDIIKSTIAYNRMNEAFNKKFNSDDFDANFSVQAVLLPSTLDSYAKEGDDTWTADLGLPAGETHKVKLTVSKEAEGQAYKIKMTFDPKLTDAQKEKIANDAKIMIMACNTMYEKLSELKNQNDAINKIRDEIAAVSKKLERNE